MVLFVNITKGNKTMKYIHILLITCSFAQGAFTAEAEHDLTNGSSLSSPPSSSRYNYDAKLTSFPEAYTYRDKPMTAEHAAWKLLPKEPPALPETVLAFMEALNPVNPLEMRTFVESVQFLEENKVSTSFTLPFLSRVSRISSELDRNSIIKCVKPYILDLALSSLPSEHLSIIIDAVITDLSMIPIDKREFARHMVYYSASEQKFYKKTYFDL